MWVLDLFRLLRKFFLSSTLTTILRLNLGMVGY
jgi:hypothetical protein